MRCTAMDVVVYFTYLLSFLTYVLPAQAQEYCNGKTLWCDKGHCCGKGKCCAYYYELWWFWLIWALIILLSCCCLYQQKRFRRRQSPSRRGNRGRPRNRSRIAQALDAAFITPIFDPDRVRLPTYDEAKEMPKDPPPYNSLYETRLPETSVGGQQTSHNPSQSLPVLRTINDAPQASLIDNEEEAAVSVDIDQWREPPPPYTTQATPAQSVHIPIPSSLPLPNPISPQHHPSLPVTCPQPTNTP
ncbi:WW domain binding protein 1-like isoform X1 [Haliotis rubra]|uniref:WW domain binding protein 1-like isoform X1 n=1 Tax=Haliotis rubra TaxID=36100 RepID=UPI001EE56652|nr:WW domain binding protein 1-like isoform X1 [Haliotis rubra]